MMDRRLTAAITRLGRPVLSRRSHADPNVSSPASGDVPLPLSRTSRFECGPRPLLRMRASATTTVHDALAGHRAPATRTAADKRASAPPFGRTLAADEEQSRRHGLLSAPLHRHSTGAPISCNSFRHTALRFRNRPAGSSDSTRRRRPLSRKGTASGRPAAPDRPAKSSRRPPSRKGSLSEWPRGSPLSASPARMHL